MEVLLGKSSVNGPFSTAMLNYQRVLPFPYPVLPFPLFPPGKKDSIFRAICSVDFTRPKVFIRQESEGTEGLVGDVEGGQQCGDPVCGDFRGIFLGSKLRIL